VVAAGDFLDTVDRQARAVCGTAPVYYAKVVLPWDEVVFSGVVRVIGRVTDG
jgi:hypothetical protein